MTDAGRRPLAMRRSPAVVAYWSNGELIVQNYATRTTVAATPLLLDVMDFCSEWRSIRSIVEHFDRFEASAVRVLVRRLVACTLLHRSDRVDDPRERALAAWDTWNPAAGFFHASTHDAPYTRDPPGFERQLRRKARKNPPPPPTKRYDRKAVVPLPVARLDGDLPAILLRRRTWRDFGRTPIELAELATLAGLTWGVQRRGTIPGQGPVVFKTSPSGGARHPIEAYVLARRVRGLPGGIYHYDADAHQLARLRRGATAREVERLLSGQRWFRNAAAVFFMTAVFAREQWRYRSPRAYRVVLIDAGHLCQTFCLLATAMQLAPFCTMALADGQIERAIGIDGISEAVIYAAGVGTRRPGATSGSWPAVLRTY
jgi:SagB-type dehydrogenase family enzyme